MHNFQRLELKTLIQKTKQKDTRDQVYSYYQSLEQLERMILSSRSKQLLRNIISIISQTKTYTQAQILLIGFLAKVYSKQLIDPIDKPPSLLKTSLRLIQFIQKGLKQNSDVFRSSCKKAWLEIYSSVLLQQNVYNKKILLYDSLEAIITGGADKISQINAVYLIEGLIDTAIKFEDSQFIKLIGKKFITLFLFPNPYMLSSMHILLIYFNIKAIKGLIDVILNKIQSYMKNIRKSSQPSLKMKLECWNQLLTINEQYCPKKSLILQLEQYVSDRVWKVQNIARQCLQIWNKILHKNEQIFNRKIQKEDLFYNCQQQVQFQKIDDQKQYDVDFFDKKNQFIKKNTGLGGGKVDFETKIMKNKSFNEKMQNIKYQLIEDDEETVEFKQKESQTQMTKIWQIVLSALKDNNYEQAYKVVLSSGDDIHLLRLLTLTGNVINNLSKKTTSQLLSKYMDIMKTDFMQKFLFSMILECKDVWGHIQNNTTSQIKNILTHIESLDNNLSETAKNIRNFL